jgi:small subunit ribosomal protein S16
MVRKKRRTSGPVIGLDKSNLHRTIPRFSPEDLLFRQHSTTTMALKIKLSRFGATHTPAYRVVISEARYRRDGAAVEQIGTYQPKSKELPLRIDVERADYWVSKGAIPTDTVRSLIKKARAAAPAVAAS